VKLIDISHRQGVDLKFKKVVHILAITCKHRKQRYQYLTSFSSNVDSEGGAVLGYLYYEKISD